MMLFTKENIIFPDTFRPDKVQANYLKSFILGSGPVYYSIDHREYKG